MPSRNCVVKMVFFAKYLINFHNHPQVKVSSFSRRSRGVRRPRHWPLLLPHLPLRPRSPPRDGPRQQGRLQLRQLLRRQNLYHLSQRQQRWWLQQALLRQRPLPVETEGQFGPAGQRRIVAAWSQGKLRGRPWWWQRSFVLQPTGDCKWHLLGERKRTRNREVVGLKPSAVCIYM